MSTPGTSNLSDARPFSEFLRTANPWLTALGLLSGALVLGGVIASGVGLDAASHYTAVLGQIPEYDAAVALTAIGFVTIALGLAIGAAWLIVNATRWVRPSTPSTSP